jgi:hypothetical protein
MRIDYRVIAETLGISPIQILVELASMSQPIEECWPACEEGFQDTIRARRRTRAGFDEVQASPRRGRPSDVSTTGALLVSRPAAAVLDKLLRKNYGLKSVRVFTLTKKWVHGSSAEDVEALVRRGNLLWSDSTHESVTLDPTRLADTEEIVAAYRALPSDGRGE